MLILGHLILWDCSPTWIKTTDTPWGANQGEFDEWFDALEQTWGTQELARDWTERFVPSRVGDQRFEEWLARWMRQAASPSAGTAMFRLSSEIDVRHILPSVQTPTLVLQGMDQLEPVEAGRFLAAKIPSSKLVELPGRDVAPWGSDADALGDEIEDLLTGTRRGPDPDRVLGTVLFTDIVDSTRTLGEVGETRWTELREAHDRLTRAELERYRGREIDTAGDGFLALFDGPARAVQCAHAISEAIRALGLVVRAGCHTGELELAGQGVRGIAVHIGARVCAMAGPGEVLVSSTVKDLAVGSGLEFEDRAVHTLKGVPGTWHLFVSRANK